MLVNGLAGGAAPRVAYQGEPGAFSEDAAAAFFPALEPRLVPLPDFAAVGAAVTRGDADFGVLPIENSIHGGVTGTYDVLSRGGLAAIAEVVNPIRHCLLGVPGAGTSSIRRVISHPVALAQCGRYLATLEGAAIEAVYDTAGAAQEVARQGRTDLAAVASRRAGQRYGLAVIAADIQDRADNATRFLLVARAPDAAWPEPGSAGPWKAMLLLEAEHRAGTLVHMLLPFAEHGVNLTRIESRPADRPWSYRFFVELVAGDGISPLDAAMRQVTARASRVLRLGCFPAVPAAAPDPERIP